MKIPCLIFSGGEPLLRRDIYELASYSTKKGIYSVLSTNGTLITKETAEKINDTGIGYIGISLDGMEYIHDYFRGKGGAFSLAVKGIENCVNKGIKTGARFTITKYNYRDLLKLIPVLIDKGIKRFCLYHLVYSSGSLALPGDDLDIKTMRHVMNSFFSLIEYYASMGTEIEFLTVDNHADGVFLYEREKTVNPERASRIKKYLSEASGCSAGSGIASVAADGSVHPCQFWRHVSLGNINERPFSEIWHDESNDFLRSIRKSREKLKGRCANCDYKEACGGCRLRAEKVYGDMWEEDPACYLTEDETGRHCEPRLS